MTDREMLEMAAKAAGHTVEAYSEEQGLLIKVRDGVSAWWKPPANYGDALRLAVKLGIDIHFHQQALNVVAGHWKQIPQEELFGNDPLAATCRAITRAAAEIGKDMP